MALIGIQDLLHPWRKTVPFYFEASFGVAAAALAAALSASLAVSVLQVNGRAKEERKREK